MYSEDKYYKWTRQSVNNLNNANLPGPPGDYLNDQATMFLYAGDKHAGENSTGTVYILGQWAHVWQLCAAMMSWVGQWVELVVY